MNADKFHQTSSAGKGTLNGSADKVHLSPIPKHFTKVKSSMDAESEHCYNFYLLECSVFHLNILTFFLADWRHVISVANPIPD